MSPDPVTILCLASYEKGADFLRECHALGARTHLITVESLRDAPWPREALAGFWRLPDEPAADVVRDAVGWLARNERIDRIVALDEFDLETAAMLREHVRVPGMMETETRRFRDKLAMRECAHAGAVLVPDFAPLFNDRSIAAFLATAPAPWIIKPRTEASAVGMRKVFTTQDVAGALDELGDRRGVHLIEQFIGGDVYHVDSIVYDDEIVFAEAHRYTTPPFDVMHRGGLFSSRTLARGASEDLRIREANRRVVVAMGIRRGVLHTEFIRGPDGRFWFLETAARVGGANIVETIEASTGINLWREWARLEVAAARGTDYTVPEQRTQYAGILISLARQEWPDTSSYDAAEIVWRLRKRHHAGIIITSPDPARVDALLERYAARFYEEFHASLPAPDKPTA